MTKAKVSRVVLILKLYRVDSPHLKHPRAVTLAHCVNSYTPFEALLQKPHAVTLNTIIPGTCLTFFRTVPDFCWEINIGTLSLYTLQLWHLDIFNNHTICNLFTEVIRRVICMSKIDNLESFLYLFRGTQSGTTRTEGNPPSCDTAPCLTVF